MSAAMAPEVRLFNFAAPGSLNANVTGADARTGVTFLNVRGPNMIRRMTLDIDIDDNVDYEVDIVRSGYPVRTLYKGDLARDKQYVPEGFPISVAPGMIQFVIRQTLGTLAARKLSIAFAGQV